MSSLLWTRPHFNKPHRKHTDKQAKEWKACSLTVNELRYTSCDLETKVIMFSSEKQAYLGKRWTPKGVIRKWAIADYRLNLSWFKHPCGPKFSSHRNCFIAPDKGGSSDLIPVAGLTPVKIRACFSMTTASSPFAMTRVGSTHWHADTIGSVLSIKLGNQPPHLFMLLLFTGL